MALLTRIDAFLANADNFSKDELREWLPEIFEWKQQLASLYDAHGLYSRPAVDIAKRLSGIDRCISKAEVLGLVYPGTNEIVFHALDLG